MARARPGSEKAPVNLIDSLFSLCLLSYHCGLVLGTDSHHIAL